MKSSNDVMTSKTTTKDMIESTGTDLPPPLSKEEKEARRRDFERVWKAPEGFRDWFASVNNQPFGNRFMGASFIFFMLAGIQALLMRVQLAVPENTFMGPEVYNQLFTMHGSTMMYLVVLPFIEGLAVYFLPQLLGNREMAYPRMSAFSFWVFFSGGLVFYSGYAINALPDAGWFVYPPLSLAQHSGLGMDFLLVGLGFIEIAGVGAGIEIVGTILKFRSPGMSLGKMPLFAWSWLVTGLMIIFAFSTLFGATVLIELDRAIGTRFFVAEYGGTPLLWQHLFWFFGHPDVYIMFIPATGMLSMIIPTFAKRPIAGYTFIVVAIVTMGFISFGLWAHHMFATGIPYLALAFFAAASIMIALSSGTQIFAWIATLWRSRPTYETPFLYVLGFFFVFVLGGITGVMVAVLPFDLQAHDTYFVVAHFHYVLIGGVIFPILAAFHYWMPLIIGRLPNERLGKISFWLTFIGFNLTFFPMHLTGLRGMARRVYTYSESLGIADLNFLSSASSFVMGAGFVVAAFNVFYSRRWGAKEVKNPWGAGTLEWALTSEMPNYVYSKIPICHSRYPLWDKEPAPSNPHYERIVEALDSEPSKWRAALVTDAVTGEPQAIQRVPGPTFIPIITAMGLLATSIMTLIQSYIAALAALVFTVIAAILWLWPDEKILEDMRESDLERRTGLPIMPTGSKASGWWAMVGALTVLGTVFAVLFYAYFYIRLYSQQWPQGDIAPPDLLSSAWMYVSGIGAAVAIYLAKKTLAAENATQTISLLSAGFVLSTVSLILFLVHLLGLPFTPQTNAYASSYFVSLAHFAVLVFGAMMFLMANAIGVFRNRERLHEGYTILHTQVTALLVYFTAVVLALGYLIFHVSPHVF